MFPYFSQNKHAAQQSEKKQVWNNILNIKSCIGQISGTWELLIRSNGRIRLVSGEMILTSKN